MLMPAKSPETRLGLIDAMRAHFEAGCSEVLSDQPVNHFTTEIQQAETATPSMIQGSMQETPQADIVTAQTQPAETPIAPATMPVMPNSDEPAAGAADAQNLAAAADSLSALKQAMQGFEGCALKKTAKNTVFSDGLEGAPVMIVGEAPGADEDRAGKPFVGRSGQLLDAMLHTIGLSREENVYIANTIAWRPIGNRTPTPEEIALCKPFICRQIELNRPKLLLFVGNVSSKTLLQTETGITRLRGTWHNYQINEIEIPAMPLLHPAYLLRRPETKKDFWADLCAVRERLNTIK
jgi:uracil-DNA glycosylase family 4